MKTSHVNIAGASFLIHAGNYELPAKTPNEPSSSSGHIPAHARVYRPVRAENEADYLGPYLLQYLAEDPKPAAEKQHVCPECGGAGTTLEPTCCGAIGGCGSPSCSGSRIIKVDCHTCGGEGLVE